MDGLLFLSEDPDFEQPDHPPPHPGTPVLLCASRLLQTNNQITSHTVQSRQAGLTHLGLNQA